MHPTSLRPSSGLEFPFTADDFRTIVEIVYERSGIVLAAHKRDMTYSRLARRLRALGLGSFRDYCALLQGKGGRGRASGSGRLAARPGRSHTPLL